VIVAVLANLPPPVAMNALNGAMDVQTDIRNPDKRDLAVATLRLGRRLVISLALAEMGLSVGLTGLVSISVGRWFVGVAAVAMVILHLLYNLEPVRLKRRGLVNPVTLGVSFAFLPCLVSYGAVRGQIDPATWLIFLGLGATVTGRALWWAAPDRAADAAIGLRTPAVRLGAVRTLVVSCVIGALGPVLLGWGVSGRYGAWWGLAAVLISAVFVGGQWPLVRRALAGGSPSSARMRRVDMTPMALANVALVALPLVAQG
jgi:4-hydroxybenzoate polyprenyltransferase